VQKHAIAAGRDRIALADWDGRKFRTGAVLTRKAA